MAAVRAGPAAGSCVLIGHLRLRSSCGGHHGRRNISIPTATALAMMPAEPVVVAYQSTLVEQHQRPANEAGAERPPERMSKNQEQASHGAGSADGWVANERRKSLPFAVTSKRHQ